MMKTLTKMLRKGGVILLSMMLPLCTWAQDYSKYTHVPGNYIELDPSKNSTTKHFNGCKWELGHDNVGYIKDGAYSTYHICVDQAGKYELSMGIRRSSAGTFTLTITDEVSDTKEFEQQYDIPKPASEYDECTFEIGWLTAGYKTVTLLCNYSDAKKYIMNYNKLTFNKYPTIASWDFSDSSNGYVQKDGSKSPFLIFYPGKQAYGDNNMFTLSTGGVNQGGLGSAILNVGTDLELREAFTPTIDDVKQYVTDATITDGSKHNFYYEISMPTIGFENVSLTAIVSHNKPNHNMYAVYSIDGGATWTGTQKVALKKTQASYVPISISIPGGQDNVLVRLHPDNNYYYYLKSCIVSGKKVSSYKVRTNAKGWASFSAVHPVSLPAGLTAYAATNVSNTYVTLNTLTQVAAEEGVFVYGTPNTEYTLNVLDEEVTKETTNLIKPILLTSVGHKVSSTETIYALATKKDVCGLYKVDTDVTVKGKAYLDATSKSLSKAPTYFNLNDDNSATGIIEIPAATVLDEAQPCYNLMGQRVGKGTKGIILTDGKKVFNK